MSERAYLAKNIRHLSVIMTNSGNIICKSVNPALKASWMPLILHLAKEKQLTVMEASKRLAVSHVQIHQLFKSMLKTKIISKRFDPHDGRQTLYELTEEGYRLIPDIKAISMAFHEVIADIETEIAIDLVKVFKLLSFALEEKSLDERVIEKLHMIKT